MPSGKLNESTNRDLREAVDCSWLAVHTGGREKLAHLLVIREGGGGEEWRTREGWRWTNGGEGVSRKGKPLSPPSSHPHHLLIHLLVQPADHWR